MLSGTLAVVTYAVGTNIESSIAVVDVNVVCIQKPILPLYDYNPTLHLCQCLNKVLFLSLWMIYPTHDLLLLSSLSIAAIEGSARPTVATNRYPIANMISFISVHGLQSPVKCTSTWNGYQTAGQCKFTVILTIYIKKSM